MAKFMYLFRHQQEGRKQPSPEEMQRLMKSWMSWLDDVKKDGTSSAPEKGWTARAKWSGAGRRLSPTAPTRRPRIRSAAIWS